METTLHRVSFHQHTEDQLIELLHTEEDRVTREVVDECVSRGERMLWRLIDLCREERSWMQTGPAYWAPVHATFILGAFEDARSLMGLLASLRWSAKYDVDWVYGKLPSIIGRIGRPAILPLKARVVDRDAGELDRITEIRALGGVAARHPIHQGEVLDFLRFVADNAEEDEAIRSMAGSVLLDFVRPGDRKSITAASIRQEWCARPSRFDARDVDAAYARSTQQLDAYQQDWLDFYAPEAIDARSRRWNEEKQDADWSDGVDAEAPWVEEQRHRFLTKYEFSLVDHDDAARGDALWVAESMTEYLVSYEGLAPWRWNGPSVFAYLMDFFARRVSLDDPGRIHVVPDNLLQFVRFCALHEYISEADLKEAEECVAIEREEFVGVALDADRRRAARAILAQLLAGGIDPRDPAAPPVAECPLPAKERKTSRRIRKK
ncbi:MAG: hypothetical protein EHM91_14680 [Planctomycetota bacterium]|nr:MAG: hypothetical protein EHM91_14680 [Planctomycetota bacterium]